MRVYFITKRLIFICILTLILIISLVFVLLNSFKISEVFNTEREIPIYSVDTDDNVVAITFDCAWGGEDIPKIVEILKEYNAKATFFAVGEWMDKYPDNIKLLSNSGHEVSNHSNSHPDMTKISKEKVIEEINTANTKIENLTGKKNNLCRTPYGSYNNEVIKTIKSMQNFAIQWDVDSLDWKELGVDAMVQRIDSRVKKGSIILFHNDTKHTVDALPTILSNLKKKGYKFATVSQLIYKENFFIDHKGIQRNLIKETSSID